MEKFSYQSAVDVIISGLESESIKLRGNGDSKDNEMSKSKAERDATYLRTLLHNLVNNAQ